MVKVKTTNGETIELTGELERIYLTDPENIIVVKEMYDKKGKVVKSRKKMHSGFMALWNKTDLLFEATLRGPVK